MSGEHIVAGTKRALILALVVPLLAGCTPYAAPPDKSSMPWWTAEPTPTLPLPVPVVPSPEPPPLEPPMLPPPPTSGPLIIDTSKVTQYVVLKVDRMTQTSWTIQIRDMLKGPGMYTVLCRGKGEIMVALRSTIGGSSGGSGACGLAGGVVSYSFDTPAPPDGTMDVTVTAPRGAQWALLVTQPAGS
ncbi:hypothetical protein [Arthrobacter sp. Y-9]|uniref:hypothetical protein n=1 Tax=Arthrobacter sp. Y-9 TaxID=3039385 RepID=UPI00241EA803|nr:hypothetical protein [Arthrobacter sp. Y-9]WFR84832.1 hypothetical protein P9849_04110 [Arthrobacter sp. Y-9]